MKKLVLILSTVIACTQAITVAYAESPEVTQFYSEIYTNCVNTPFDNQHLQKSVSKLPEDFATTTCSCAITQMKSGFTDEKLALILHHNSDDSHETPLQKAYAKSLISAFSDLATKSGADCRHQYFQNHNLKEN